MGKFFALNIGCFAENSAFVAIYGLLVKHLVAKSFALGDTILAIPILYLQGEYSPEYRCLSCENKVFTVLSENTDCYNLRAFWVKKYCEILSV